MKRLSAVILTVLAACLDVIGAPQLRLEDVRAIMEQAVSRAWEVNRQSCIAIVDREGYVLGVWDVSGGAPPRNDFIAGAVSRAGTAAFLSSNENAFTSRTAGYIIQQHFPPKVRNTPPGPLVGVGLSNVYLSPDRRVGARIVGGLHSDVNFIKQIPFDVPPGTFDPNSFFNPANPFVSPGTFGAGIARPNNTVAPGTGVPGTSLNDPPGGVPLYIDDKLVGGIGVTGDGSPINTSTGLAIVQENLQKDATPGFKFGPDIDEDIALAGQRGYEPRDEIKADNVLINGIRIPYVNTETRSPTIRALGSVGRVVRQFPLQQSPPPFHYAVRTIGGVEGEIRFPFRDDPFRTFGPKPTIDGAERLTAEEVETIIAQAAERARNTRAGIRLPVPQSAKVFISVVGNPDQPGKRPPILGIFRTGEATIFSWDVSVQKARTAIFFSTDEFAQSTRTVGFLAQRFYPPGLDGRAPGPYFGIQESLLLNAARAGLANNNIPNGITIFPGGFPLYRNGRLIGAIGISGDGVDQDDLIGISGCEDYAPREGIRADQYSYRGARLPFVKFPRDPEL